MSAKEQRGSPEERRRAKARHGTVRDGEGGRIAGGGFPRGRGEAVDGELAAGRVLKELEEGAALLFDEGEEEGRGDVGAGGPERVQLGEDRRVRQGERGGVVGEADREAKRVGGQERALRDEAALLGAEAARHRPRGRREDLGRGPAAERRKGGKEIEGVHVASLTVYSLKGKG